MVTPSRCFVSISAGLLAPGVLRRVKQAYDERVEWLRAANEAMRPEKVALGQTLARNEELLRLQTVETSGEKGKVASHERHL